MKKHSIGDIVFTTVNTLILTLLTIMCVYPMLYVAFASFSNPSAFSVHQGLLWKPLGFTIEGYRLVFENPSILSGYANTVFYVVAGTLINLFFTCLGAFGFSRKNLLLGWPLFMLVLFTMYFGGGLIPSYLNIKNLGMLNTRWSLLIPGAVSTYNMVVMRTAFMSIPASLEESAKIDGANEFVVLTRIILPLSKATLAVIALYYAVGHWNSWFSAMIYLRNRNLYPLQTILREILMTDDLQSMSNVSSVVEGDTGGVFTYQARQLVKYCTIIVATLPVLCVYPFAQKYFVRGVMIGAVKG
ncbi:sugar ABC transporter permease [Clostridia bacterium]|nr:sugar ABC transporter permease [Clostridia bacterium]